MPLASTWFDPVIGLDIHFEIVPVVPFPVPFPHPFVGLVFDPIGLLLGLAISNGIGLATGAQTGLRGPVLVNSLPATTTGTVAVNWILLPHFPIPPGVFWSPMVRIPVPPFRPGEPLKLDLPIPPPGDSIIVTGSKTVHFLGLNAARLGDIGLSCSDPLRLPLSFILAIPKGAPVEVGGPMALDFMAALMCLLRTKWIQDGIGELVDRISGGRLRSLFSAIKCFFTGHPVDVATGRVMTWATDFSLPGLLPFAFERTYGSSWADRDSPLGFGWSHPYDQAVWSEPGRLVYRAGDGREIELDVFDRPGRVLRPGEEVFDPISRCTLRCLDGGRFRVHDPAGLVLDFAPVPGDARDRARLVRIATRGGDAFTCAYDRRGLLASVDGPRGPAVRFDHDDAGRIAAVSLPHPSEDGWVVHTRYVYTEEGDLAEVLDPLGGVTRYAYEAHLLVQETDRNGHSFYFGYDGRSAAAYCVRTWGDGGIFDHEIVYDKQRRVTWVTDSLGATTTYRMNRALAVTEIEDAEGHRTRFVYDDALQLVSITDALGNETRYEHDARGNRTRVLAPDGSEVRVEYDANDRPVRIVNGVGAEWRRRYDGAGRLVEAIDPLGGRRRFEREGARVTASVAPNGARASFRYDGAGLLVRRRSEGGLETDFEYDRRARLTAVRDSTGREIHLAYDAEGRVLAVTGAGGEPLRRCRYDAEGNVLASEDAAGVGPRFTYAGRRSLSSVERGGRRVALRYDTEGRLAAVENEIGEVHRLTRDRRGHVVAETGFDGRSTRYHHDAVGRLARRVRPGGAAVAYERDARGRLVRVRRSDGTESRFAYRADGALVAADNEAASVRFERDLIGRVVAERQGDHTVTSRYDACSRRVGLSSSATGLDLAIARGPLGDVEALETGGFSVRFMRDAGGLERARELPGGVALRWAYDARGRPARREVHHPGGSEERAYQWGPGRALAAIDDRGRGRTRFEHDADGRLVSATYPDGDESVLAPDAAGRVRRRRDGSDRVYGRGGALASADGARYEHDADGQVCRKVLPDGRAYRYVFDAAGMLSKVLGPDESVVSFAYDALGRRVRKTVDGASTAWIWDGDRLLHELPDGGHPVTWLVHPQTFAPVAKLEGASRYAVVTDPIGTPEALYDDTGALTWQMQLDLYGVPRARASARTVCPLRFPGQYADEETGLCYNRFRYYDPATGRYLSPDPIGLHGGLDAYAYVDDPITKIDPLGLIEDCDIDAVTKQVMDRYGLTQDSELFRSLEPKWLNMDDMTVAGNPNSIARISDPYSPRIENPDLASLRGTPEEIASLPDSMRYIEPRIDPASLAGPGLNVTVEPSAYNAPGLVTIAIRLGDVLDAGGRIYPDVSAEVLHALYVTFNGSIPFWIF
jgi:RHS repeat-associated protein